MGFVKATKKESKIRMAIYGPSGSGKTYTCLTIAGVLGKHVGVIDTERGRAAKYADRFDFSVLELGSFSPREYISAIREAEEAGIDCLVIDSLSHAWNGQGGCLEMVDRISSTSTSKNTFNAWGKVTPEHQQLLEAIMSYRGHILATMRAKTEYVVEQINGRSVPKKVGLAPVQREGVEYEFDILGDMDTSHILTITKSLVPELQDKQIHCPDRRVGDAILRWLRVESKVEKKEESRPQPQPPSVELEVNIHAMSQKDLLERERLIGEVQRLYQAGGLSHDDFVERLVKHYGINTIFRLKNEQLNDLVSKLNTSAVSDRQHELIEQVEQFIVAKRMNRAAFSARLKEVFGVDTVDQLREDQLDSLLQKLQAPKTPNKPMTTLQAKEIGRLVRKVDEEQGTEEFSFVVDGRCQEQWNCTAEGLTQFQADELILWLEQQLIEAQDRSAKAKPTQAKQSGPATSEQIEEILELGDSLYRSKDLTNVAIRLLVGVSFVGNLTEDQAEIILEKFREFEGNNSVTRPLHLDAVRNSISRYYTDPDIAAEHVEEWIGAANIAMASDAMLLVLPELIEQRHRLLVEAVTILQGDTRISTEEIPSIPESLIAASIDQLLKAKEWLTEQATKQEQQKKEQQKQKRAESRKKKVEGGVA